MYAIMLKGAKSKDEFAVSRPLFAACDAARLVAFVLAQVVAHVLSRNSSIVTVYL